MNVIDQTKIQGLVFTGYMKLPFATYVMLEIEDGKRAQVWLEQLIPFVTDGRKQELDRAVNVALSAAGLVALGLPPTAMATFPREFVEGMAGSAARSRILGDTGDSAPQHWHWGGRTAVHLIFMLYAKTEDVLAKMTREQTQRALEHGLRVVFVRDTQTIPDGREHFGFRDGLSQPRIKGSEATQTACHTVVQPGEFVLGYLNEYDELPPSPTVASDPVARQYLPRARMPGPADRLHDQPERCDLGANGSYLVVRQLAQDVQGFWAAMYQHGSADDRDDARAKARAIELAAKCMGRWPNGAPLALAPDNDDPTLAEHNQFGYENDPNGARCPVGAHVRRANPRDSLEPGPEESARLLKRHMILRRGRTYGRPLAPFETEDPPCPRGLIFVAVSGNIQRQFEFVQQTWLNNPTFDGLNDESDPITGARERGRGTNFSFADKPVRRRLTGLPAFVTTQGGEYFFLPGLSALRYLASVVTP